MNSQCYPAFYYDISCKNLFTKIMLWIMYFIRYIVIQRLMKPRRVVEVEVGYNAFALILQKIRRIFTSLAKHFPR